MKPVPKTVDEWRNCCAEFLNGYFIPTLGEEDEWFALTETLAMAMAAVLYDLYTALSSSEGR